MYGVSKNEEYSVGNMTAINSESMDSVDPTETERAEATQAQK